MCLSCGAVECACAHYNILCKYYVKVFGTLDAEKKVIYILFNLYLVDRLLYASLRSFHSSFMDLGILIAQPRVIGKTCLYQHFDKTKTKCTRTQFTAVFS